MDMDFEAKRLKPGDPGYQYDVSKDFGKPSEVAEWDEDDEDEDWGAELFAWMIWDQYVPRTRSISGTRTQLLYKRVLYFKGSVPAFAR